MKKYFQRSFMYLILKSSFLKVLLYNLVFLSVKSMRCYKEKGKKDPDYHLPKKWESEFPIRYERYVVSLFEKYFLIAYIILSQFVAFLWKKIVENKIIVALIFNPLLCGIKSNLSQKKELKPASFHKFKTWNMIFVIIHFINRTKCSVIF